MVVFGVEIEVICVAQQADAEESVGVDVERLGERWLHGLDVVDVLHFNLETSHLNLLHRFPHVVQYDAGEESRVCSYHRLYGLAEPIDVEALVERIEERKIVANLATVVDALYIDAVLRLA